MLTKKISALLALLCIASLLAGCGSSDTPANVVTDSGETTAADSGEAAETKATANLPDKDFEGAEIAILTWPSEETWYLDDFIADGIKGEPLNDAVYMRNTAVEERYHVSLKPIQQGRSDFTSSASNVIMAGDDIYAIINGSLDGGENMAQKGYLYDLTSLDYIDLDQPWWDQRFNSDMSIAHHLFQALGDINKMDDQQTWGFIFNKDMFDAFNLGNPYSIVFNGEWTLDRMYTMMTTVAGDLNGDGKMDQNDRWGLETEHANFSYHFLGAGERMVRKDANDIPYLTLNTERGVAALEKIFEYVHDKSVVFNAQDWGSIAASSIYLEYIIPMFINDQALFYFTGIGNTYKHMRDMNSAYGLLPTPKYDEAQDSYYNTVSAGWCTSVCIPVTCADPDRSAFLLEALAAESVDTVSPAFYEVIFANKALRDEESMAIAELIFQTRVFDVGFFNKWGSVTELFWNITAGSTMDFASRYASSESKMQADMEATIALYEELF